MLVNFTKAHSLGNDFVLIDLITQRVRLHSAYIKRIADRHLGVGCDQVLLIEPPMRPEADFYCRIFNADGHEVEQCGNGMRCAGRFVVDSGLVNRNDLIVDYIAGQMQIKLEDHNSVTVNLGQHQPEIQESDVTIGQHQLKLYSLSLGNPHAVHLVNDINNVPRQTWGEQLSRHSLFPNGANIGFMQVVDRSRIRLQVFERGSGLTHACGSGACAAVLVGKHLNLLDKEAQVTFTHGSLKVKYDSSNGALYLTGATTSVFTGKFRF